MRPDDCPRCDAATTRSAQLVTQLRRAAKALHLALGHPTHVEWFRCGVWPCTEHADVAAGARMERPA